MVVSKKKPPEPGQSGKEEKKVSTTHREEMSYMEGQKHL